MKIFEALRKDHDKQRALVKMILDTQGDSSTRKDFFRQLKCELATHAVAEERFFYAPLMHTDQTVDMSRHGVAEHHQIDKLVAELEKTDMSSANWLSTFKKLADKIEHHLAEEERVFFQQAGKAFSEKEKIDLADEYLAQMKA
ncbi:MAG: hemerythrin superfamily protein [Glaciecola sp.]|jgi:hemerythrin superfamily protein